MPVLPNGFTDITPDYLPYDDPPSLTGLINDDPPLLVDGKLALGSTFITAQSQQPVPATPEASWILTANLLSPYPKAGDLVTIQCSVKTVDQAALQGSLLLRLYGTTGVTTDLPTAALVSDLSLSNATNTVTFNLPLGRNNSTGCQLQFVVHPALTTTIPPLALTQAEYAALPVSSNLITFTVVAASAVGGMTPPAPPKIASLPLHDALPTLLGSTFKSYSIEEIVDLSATNSAPQGSSGVGLYKDRNLPSPFNASMHKATPSAGIQRLLGMTTDQLQRLESWAEKLLHQTHSKESDDPLSELNLLQDLLPDDVKAALDRYASLIQQAGKYTTDIAKSYAPDYAYGNTLHKSNAVVQHNVGQFRVQTSSTFDAHAPSLNFTAQMSLTQARFEHHVGDLYQAGHTHIFTRAEDSHTQMATYHTRYSSQSSQDQSANATYATGKLVHYADTAFHQVGQSSGEPLHQSNSQSSGAIYGTHQMLVQKHYQLQTKTGELSLTAGDAANLHAQKLIQLSSATDGVRADAALDVNLKAGQNLNGYGANAATITTAGTAQFSAVGSTFLTGSTVFINCGRSGVRVPPSQTPKILNLSTLTFPALQDPTPYTKTAPITPAPVGQRLPLTPEPNSLLDGSDQLGQFLTGSY